MSKLFSPRARCVSRLGGLLRGLLAAGAVGSVAVPASATEVDRLLDLDLARLLDVPVTLATRTERPAFATAAAVYVLDGEDIRRSGYRRLVDVLRLLPGVHVGRGNAGQYGVSVRNGMNRFASTALVMIDGRHVYTPLFGGVRWETQELPVDSIERIELVRGPGGPLWGANAVDGIVHVVTRRPRPGTTVNVSAGSGELARDLGVGVAGAGPAELRWSLDLRALRVDPGEYLPAARSTHGGTRTAGAPAHDGGDGWLLRARADGRAGDGTWTTIAGVSGYRLDEDRALLSGVRPNTTDHANRFVTLDWRAPLAGGDALRLRLSADQGRVDDDILDESQTLLDADLQLDGTRGAHQLTVGAGLRHYRSRFVQPQGVPCSACFALWPAVRELGTLSLFAQDQWAFAPGWTAVFGAKFEATTQTERDWQPTMRLLWRPGADRTAWVAVTRPVRTPTRSERDAAFAAVPSALQPFFGCRAFEAGLCLSGDPAARSWHVLVVEGGWRQRWGDRADLDLSAFRSEYDFRQRAVAPGDATGQRIAGLEAVARWQASPAWRVEWQSAWHRGREPVALGPERPVALLPRQSHQLKLRGTFGPWSVDCQVHRVGDVSRRASPSRPAIVLPDRTQARLRVAWSGRSAGEWSLVLGGLGSPDRGEYVEASKVNTAPRSSASVAWRLAL